MIKIKPIIISGIIAISMNACGVKSYSINFNSNGGSNVESQTIRQGEKISKPDNPIKTGYDFTYWTYKSKEWSFDNDVVSSDMTLDANWKLSIYSISYELDGGTNNSDNPTTYTIEENKELFDPVKKGNTFVGWYNGTTKITNIPKGSYGDLTLTAHWSTNSYTVIVNNEDSTKGEVSGGGTYEYKSNVTLSATPFTGYSLQGWYQGSNKVSSLTDYSFNMNDNNVTYEAKWSRIYYNIYYELDGGVNDIFNPETYSIDTERDLYDATKEGYTFLGWFKDDTKISKISKGWYGDLTLTAHWEINLYSVALTSSDSNKGTVLGSGLYVYNSSVTVTAKPIGDNIFNGWYRDSELKELITKDTSYTFNVPSGDVDLYAGFWSPSEEKEWNKSHGGIPTLSSDKKYIAYGLYPQTYVNDASLVSILNKLTYTNELGYHYYNNDFYYKFTATPYEGDISTFDDGTTIVAGSSYWFKVEPIKWKILENKSGTYFVMSESLLINHRFNENYHDLQLRSDYQGNTANVYSNNYKYSEIRSWLNTDFYNQTFFMGNTNIKISTVDNSLASTLDKSNNYICEDTNDKLFLLSMKELTNKSYGFDTNPDGYNPARTSLTTDYARAHGALPINLKSYLHNGLYYTRSPDCDSSLYVHETSYGGNADSLTLTGDNYCCVRPALRLTL